MLRHGARTAGDRGRLDAARRRRVADLHYADGWHFDSWSWASGHLAADPPAFAKARTFDSPGIAAEFFGVLWHARLR